MKLFLRSTFKTWATFIFCVITFTSFSQCPTTSLTPNIIVNNYYGEVTIQPQFDVTPTLGFITCWMNGAAGSYSTATSNMTNNITFNNVATGNYSVCLKADSLVGGCPAVIGCVQIVVNSIQPCSAGFTYSTDANCITHFVNTSTGSSLQYQWQINGTTYNTTDVDVTLPNGNYNASLITNVTVAPSTYVSCDTVSQLVHVACSPCNVSASFNIVADTVTPGNFYIYNASTGTGTLNYTWDFGDGTALSTQPYPTHQYAIPGQYIVCFTVTATSGTLSCSSSYCDSSSVHKSASGFLMSKITVLPATVTGINSNELFTDLKTYPNPIKDNLIIEMKLATKQTLTYTIVNAFGKIILKNAITEFKTDINTSELAQGFYILNIADADGKPLRAIKLVK